MTTATPRFLRLPQVRALTGLSPDTIYRYIREDRFPAQCRIGDRAIAWREDQIRAWIESRPVRSPKSVQPPAAA